MLVARHLPRVSHLPAMVCQAGLPLALSPHNGYTCIVADVCLRSGKWYYEVEFIRMPRAHAHVSVNVGWLSAKANHSQATQYQLGGDGTGMSWGYSVSTHTFAQNGGVLLSCLR